MEGQASREMTLDEWVERLPEVHSARKEYAALRRKLEIAELKIKELMDQLDSARPG